MRPSIFRALALATLLPFTLPAQQATGRITGQVVDAVTGKGLSDVGLQVNGTSIGAMSGVDGRYAINNIP